MNRRRFLTTLTAVGFTGLAGCNSGDETTPTKTRITGTPTEIDSPTPTETEEPTPTPRESPDTIFVSPDGDKGNPGTESAPLNSIRHAVGEAEPGQTVYVQPGEYFEFVPFNEPGEPDAPITLTGPPEAVLKPPKEIDHSVIAVGASHIHITGLTITGLYNPDAPKDPTSYHNGKLIDLNTFAETLDDYIEGLVISPHRIGGVGQSLINTQLIKNCELGGFRVIGSAGTDWILDESEGHNGEIIYLGTAPGNTYRKNWDGYDQTRNIRVHHIDNSEGHPHSELVDCKAGTRNITIEYCTDGGGAQEHEGGKQPSIRLDGHRTTVRWCRIQGSEGPAIHIGPQHLRRENGSWLAEPETELEREMGTEHAIYGNALNGYSIGAVDYFHERKRPERDTNPTPEDQRHVCGNEFDGEPGIGTPGEPCDDVPQTEEIGHLGGNSPWA